MTAITAERSPESDPLQLQRVDYIPSNFFVPTTFEEERMSEDQLLLHKLRESRDYSTSEEFLQSMAGVAQRFADKELYEQSSDPETLEAVIAHTKEPDLEVKGFRVYNKSDGAIADYNYPSQTVGLNEAYNESQADHFKRLFKLAGVKVKDPSDILLLRDTYNIGHEMGHARFHALSKLIAGKVTLPWHAGEDGEMNTALYLYDQMHPAKSFDPHPKIAAQTRNEATAEGYSHLAVRRMLLTCGYTEKEANSVVDEIRRNNVEDVKKGLRTAEHAVDFLGNRKAMEDYLNGDNGRGWYAGRLGYAHAMSAKSLDEQIRELGEFAWGERTTVTRESSQAYQPDAVAQEPEVADYISMLRDLRKTAKMAEGPIHERFIARVRQVREGLRSPNQRERKRFGRRVMAAALVGTLAIPATVELSDHAGQWIEAPIERLLLGHDYAQPQPSNAPFIIINNERIPLSNIQQPNFHTTGQVYSSHKK